MQTSDCYICPVVECKPLTSVMSTSATLLLVFTEGKVLHFYVIAWETYNLQFRRPHNAVVTHGYRV